MEIAFEPLRFKHSAAVMDILNYWAKTDTSLFANSVLPDEFFSALLKRSENLSAYAVTLNGLIVGFCSLSPFNAFKSFEQTLSTTIFLNPKFISMGIGSACLKKLESDAKRFGANCIVAEISDENEKSISFHQKFGYELVGRLKKVASKFGHRFGIVYMQKFL